MEKYNPKKIETKWQKIWEEKKLYQAKDFSEKPKFYCLDMFPYPSGEGLHVGHWRGCVLSDVLARFQMLNGKNVLHPMGWDAFGLPAENAAIKNQSHPKIYTQKAITKFKSQLKQIGAMFDWSREINTSEPLYYKWTQWLFLKLYENKLAYRKKAPVNWCPNCQTVLANEQVIAGECERCSAKVIKKNLTQWFFKITAFADDLLKGLDNLDWPERTKNLQRNWIGRSEGISVKFKIRNSKQYLEVFTTRPDTLFGATFIVLAPEHELVEKITTNDNKKKVHDYIKKVQKESDIERESIEKEKTGIFTGSYAINPINNEKIPIWITDYILSSYGTGACMAVPAHDQRDFEFAQKFKLPIKMVICPNYPAPVCPVLDKAFEKDGHLIESGKFTGLTTIQAQKAMTEWLEEKNLGKSAVNFRLHDWLISRQRYWGAPIPIIYCEKCGEVPVPEKDLPVKLPENVEFKPTGVSPLKSVEEFLNVTCPKCGGPAKRETDTMDTFVDSSWYYFRYTDPQNDNEIANDKKIKYYLPVDLYIGGIEHAILHLLYARFISYALHKLKLVQFSLGGEPFGKLFNIGMVYLHGAKMSKSKRNIVSPDDLIEKYGTDALRGYELFIGPADLDSQWQVSGIVGIFRFLEKIWQIYHHNIITDETKDPYIEQTIQVVTKEIQLIRPNTAISHLMELFNYIKQKGKLSSEYAKKINILLAPFFPHLAEEIWQIQKNNESIFQASWPKYDENLVQNLEIIMPIQISGKTRTIIKINKNTSQEEIIELAKNTDKVKPFLKNQKIKKIVYVSGKIINFVVE